MRALGHQELVELLGELARAHRGAVVRVEDGDLDREAERLELGGDAVEVGDGTYRLEAGPAVDEHDREAGGLALAADRAHELEVVVARRVGAVRSDMYRELARARDGEDGLGRGLAADQQGRQRGLPHQRARLVGVGDGGPQRAGAVGAGEADLPRALVGEGDVPAVLAAGRQGLALHVLADAEVVALDQRQIIRVAGGLAGGGGRAGGLTVAVGAAAVVVFAGAGGGRRGLGRAVRGVAAGSVGVCPFGHPRAGAGALGVAAGEGHERDRERGGERGRA
ncbi:hypothetical protein [Nannocystis pusilla]|uniref:hypothetical protein n=1 Tax=Nannocystis pusilla TaxID=889268 RepID=UPI003B79FA42